MKCRWWYLSFAAPDHFLGGAIVEANSMIEAVQSAHRLGCNPGGEVRGWPIFAVDALVIPREFRNRLLSRREVGLAFQKPEFRN